MAANCAALGKYSRGWVNRWWAKRQVTRKRRRLEKRLFEDTPVRITKGWID